MDEDRSEKIAKERRRIDDEFFRKVIMEVFRGYQIDDPRANQVVLLDALCKNCAADVGGILLVKSKKVEGPDFKKAEEADEVEITHLKLAHLRTEDDLAKQRLFKAIGHEVKVDTIFSSIKKTPAYFQKAWYSSGNMTDSPTANVGIDQMITLCNTNGKMLAVLFIDDTKSKLDLSDYAKPLLKLAAVFSKLYAQSVQNAAQKQRILELEIRLET